ncbi:MAG: diguanylate cyclase [Spirochaetales bacterium]|nr:diguanylate cyclase [Spirochaetales bacterium]
MNNKKSLIEQGLLLELQRSAIVKILLVDDRQENLMALEALLEDSHDDLDIYKANSGNKALEMVLENDFCLILLDVMMPEMDGYETAVLLRSNKRTRQTPIIFVTANNINKEHVFKGYDSGAVDYLRKPIEPHILNSKVSIFIDLYKHKNALEDTTSKLNSKVVELEKLHCELENKNKQLELLSNMDALTGVYNRRFFNEILEKDWSRSIRENAPISLFIIDIDYFKKYNDTYGHTAGDKALKKVAQAASGTIKRNIDTFARYGGEEFSAILPGTECSAAVSLAEEMIEAVRILKIPHTASATNFVTISLGCATYYNFKEYTVMDLVNTADSALYEAKESGRNIIISKTV